VLAACGHRETEWFVVGDGRIQVADEYHQMVQPGQHRKLPSRDGFTKEMLRSRLRAPI
jgi:hypothetical protein